MKTPLHPAFGALLAHANLNLLSLGLAPLDLETLGEQSPATQPGTDAGERGSMPFSARPIGVESADVGRWAEPVDLDTRLDARGKEEVWWGGGWRSPCCLPADAACLWVARRNEA